MEGYVKAATIENHIEALLLESLLRERSIPHFLRSYHDTAYDGLFQAQKGWGVVTVPEERVNEVLEILQDIRDERGAAGD
jgi:hypothetical protein